MDYPPIFLSHLICFFPLGPDPSNPRTMLDGLARLYRGLGVSALRSVTTHGLLWTFYDIISNYVDRLPRPNGGGGDD